MTWRRSEKNPESVFVWTGAVADALDWSFFLPASIWWVKEAGLSPFQLVSLGIVVHITVLTLEIPTGVVSDLVSRKRSIVLSRLLMGTSFLLVVMSKNYWLLLPAQVLGGMAWTLRSGTEVAWVTDELASRVPTTAEVDNRVEGALLRRHRLGMILAVGSILLSIVLSTVSLRLAIVTFGLGYIVLGSASQLVLVERAFSGAKNRGATFVSTFRQGWGVVRGRPRLRKIVVLAASAAFVGDVLDYLGLKRFLDATGTSESSLIPLGLWFLAAVCVGSIVNALVSKQLVVSSAYRTATAMMLVASFGVAVVALSDLAVLIAIGLLAQDSVRETFAPVLESWINSDASTDVRATVHSMIGQIESTIEIVGGLFFGMIAQVYSVPVAMIIIAIWFVGVAWLASRVPERSKQPEEEVATGA